MKRLSLLSVVAIVAFASCKKDNTTTVGPSVIISATKTVTVNFSPTSSYAFFRFSDSSVVANSDSATSKWDFGIRFTTFITNSHASGPGNGAALLQTGTTFDAVTTAPTTGYGYDTTSSQLAINPNTWYNYNPTTHAFSPKAGQVFIFKTADGAHYAKMEMLAVDYATFSGTTPVTLFYKFRYSYQANGTATF